MRTSSTKIEPSCLEGHAGAVTHGPSSCHELVDPDRGELGDALGLTGHLDGDDISATGTDTEQVDIEDRLTVLVQLLQFGIEVDGRFGRSSGHEADR